MRPQNLICKNRERRGMQAAYTWFSGRHDLWACRECLKKLRAGTKKWERVGRLEREDLCDSEEMGAGVEKVVGKTAAQLGMRLRGWIWGSGERGNGMHEIHLFGWVKSQHTVWNPWLYYKPKKRHLAVQNIVLNVAIHTAVWLYKCDGPSKFLLKHLYTLPYITSEVCSEGMLLASGL